MRMASVKLNKRNQMILPKAAREALDIKPGERAQVLVCGRTVHLLPEPEKWSDYIYGLRKEVWALLGEKSGF